MINDHEAYAVLVWIAFIHSSRVFVRAKLRRVLRPDIVTAVDPNLPTSSPSDHFDMSKSGGAASSSSPALLHASFPSKPPPSLQGFLGLKAVVFACC